jgi:hypothetical protein
MICLIEYLFGITIHHGSAVRYLSTDALNKNIGEEFFSDFILGISQFLYHLEFQRSLIKGLFIRTLEQSLLYTMQSLKSTTNLEHTLISMPHSVIIFLGEYTSFSEYVDMELYNDAVRVIIDIKIFKVLDLHKDEFFYEGIIALLPFHILKHKKKVEKLHEEKKLSDINIVNNLRNELVYGLLDVINKGVDEKLLSYKDSEILMKMTTELYRAYYGKKYLELAWEDIDMEEKFWGPIFDKTSKTMESIEQKLLDTQQMVEATKQMVEATKQMVEATKLMVEATKQEVEATKQEVKAVNAKIDKLFELLLAQNTSTAT